MPAAPKGRRRRAPKAGLKAGPSSTRVGLLEAGLRAFAAHGFEGASTRDIASAAGVPQGLVRHHFGSKEGLWRSVIADAVAGLCRDLDEACRSEGEEGDERSQALTIAGWVRCLPRRSDLLAALVHAVLAPGPMRDFALTEVAPIWERLRALQRRARGGTSNEERLAMWVGASLALPVFAAALEPAVRSRPEHNAIAQRDTLYAWLTENAAAQPAGPFSLAAARTCLRG